MEETSLALGIDFGTSGVRIAIINSKLELIYTSSLEYSEGIHLIDDWKNCATTLISSIPKKIKSNVTSLAVDGTSGTLIACSRQGFPIGNALAYNISCPEHSEALKEICPNNSIVSSSNSSLARAMSLISLHGSDILLRHQADWINGWLLNNWEYGEEGNNIRLGWNLINKTWPQNFVNLPWNTSLPKIVSSGC